MHNHTSLNYTGTFVISFDGMMVAPSGKEFKILLLEIMQAFNNTGQDATNIKETNYERSLAHVKEAHEVSLQAPIYVEHDDIVILVKLA